MSLEERIASLEAKIEVLIGALAANTDALNSGGSTTAAAEAPAATAADKKGGAKKKTAAKSKPKPVEDNSNPFADDGEGDDVPTVEKLREVAFKYRDSKGADAAKKIIEKFAPKLGDVPAEKRAALIAAFEAALEGDDL